MKLMGYRRPDGSFGNRKDILVILASVWTVETAAKIANSVQGAVSLPHQHGC